MQLPTARGRRADHAARTGSAGRAATRALGASCRCRGEQTTRARWRTTLAGPGRRWSQHWKACNAQATDQRAAADTDADPRAGAHGAVTMRATLALWLLLSGLGVAAVAAQSTPVAVFCRSTARRPPPSLTRSRRLTRACPPQSRARWRACTRRRRAPSPRRRPATANTATRRRASSRSARTCPTWPSRRRRPACRSTSPRRSRRWTLSAGTRPRPVPTLCLAQRPGRRPHEMIASGPARCCGQLGLHARLRGRRRERQRNRGAHGRRPAGAHRHDRQGAPLLLSHRLRGQRRRPARQLPDRAVPVQLPRAGARHVQQRRVRVRPGVHGHWLRARGLPKQLLAQRHLRPGPRPVPVRHGPQGRRLLRRAHHADVAQRAPPVRAACARVGARPVLPRARPGATRAAVWAERGPGEG